MAIPAGPATTIIGKTLCYLVIYMPICIYVLHIVPLMFSLPHIGHLTDYLFFILPMLVASSFLAQALSVFVTERESSMLVIVFTSVVFLFLSAPLCHERILDFGRRHDSRHMGRRRIHQAQLQCRYSLRADPPLHHAVGAQRNIFRGGLPDNPLPLPHTQACTDHSQKVKSGLNHTDRHTHLKTMEYLWQQVYA